MSGIAESRRHFSSESTYEPGGAREGEGEGEGGGVGRRTFPSRADTLVSQHLHPKCSVDVVAINYARG